MQKLNFERAKTLKPGAVSQDPLKRFNGLFIGPAGSGKTHSALLMATTFMQMKYPDLSTEEANSKVLLLQVSETAGIYFQNDFPGVKYYNIVPKSFDKHSVWSELRNLITQIKSAGFEATVIDSGSAFKQHELNVVASYDEPNAKRGTSVENRFTQVYSAMKSDFNKTMHWIQNSSGIHVFMTIRTELKWKNDKDLNGKPVYVGKDFKPVMKDGTDFYFDFVCNLNEQHEFQYQSFAKIMNNCLFLKEPVEVERDSRFDGLPPAVELRIPDDFPKSSILTKEHCKAIYRKYYLNEGVFSEKDVIEKINTARGFEDLEYLTKTFVIYRNADKTSPVDVAILQRAKELEADKKALSKDIARK